MSAERMIRTMFAAIIGGCIGLGVSAPDVWPSALLLGALALTGYVAAWRLDELQ